MLPPHDLSQLPGEWWVVHGTPEGEELERELAREMAPGHVLAGVAVEAVSVRRHLKDVIFWLPGTAEWAHVHLTYRQESDSRWPMPTLVSDWAEIVAELADPSMPGIRE